MLRSRLALKITLLIVAVLIVGFGVSTIVTIQRESSALVEQNKQAVRRLTQAVVASIEAAMLQERPDVTRSLIQELRELRAQPREDTSPLESLMIYRRNGVEAFTDMATAAVLPVALRYVVVGPVGALSAVARGSGGGDFEARAPAARSDEIGELGGAFNDMASRLAEAHTELATKNKELQTALQNLQESRQRVALLEQLKGELSKFVPDAVKKLLEQNPNATELEKRTVEVSVVFLAIAGYTKLSEQLDARRLNQLVQTYFSSFLEIIQKHHGDVNETAGDGLMVIFQSERSSTDHALNATRAAFAIHQRTGTLNEEYGGIFPSVQLHMGINTGEALVGATKLGAGAGQRWTFTATGPTTNVAARFAGSAQGGEIVVGPATAERIRGHFVLESLGEKTFKNVSQPIHVYRVIPPGIYEKIV